jgi:alpha-methylacyl-CoA racemase
MSLRGIRVLEIAGLAPVPYCGMLLADHGADVVRVDRVNDRQFDPLARGKRSVALDLKAKSGVAALQRMADRADVLIEPFRPGVMEKLGLGPDVLLKRNKRLVYARISGYGQTGPQSMAAGHDMNYLSLVGMLEPFGQRDARPAFAANLLADFAGGGLMCAMGILMALVERQTSGAGQVVDAGMSDGAAYVGAFVAHSRDALFAGPRGTNMLDSGAHFYDTYETKDGKFMAVGAIEPKFYAELLRVLELELPYEPMDQDHWLEMKQLIAARIKTRTRDDWAARFRGVEACTTPVLALDEAPNDPHNKARGTYLANGEVASAPRLSRTAGYGAADSLRERPINGQHTVGVLKEYGFSAAEIAKLIDDGAAQASEETNAKL